MSTKRALVLLFLFTTNGLLWINVAEAGFMGSMGRRPVSGSMPKPARPSMTVRTAPKVLYNAATNRAYKGSGLSMRQRVGIETNIQNPTPQMKGFVNTHQGRVDVRARAVNAINGARK